MVIRSADFIISNTDPGRSPASTQPEFAFIGRSNVGKSSLLNLLVDRKNLAKTSSTPGKTQTINHFYINKEWYLVDLPGYGYASVNKTKHRTWGPMIETYLKKRLNLTNTFVLLDSRLEPQKIDKEFIQWMGDHSLAFSLVFTKTDKLKKNQLAASLKAWEKTLLQTWETLPPIFLTSASERKGREELLTYIESLLSSD